MGRNTVRYGGLQGCMVARLLEPPLPSPPSAPHLDTKRTWSSLG